MNLLSSVQKDTIRREYLWRLFEVGAFVVITLLLIALVLLLPSGVFLSVETMSVENALEQAKNQRAILEKDVTTQALVKEVRTRLEILRTASSEPPDLSAIFKTVLSHRAFGVSITSLIFDRTPEGGDTRGAVTFSGMAETRARLLAFVASLEAEPTLVHIDSPISNLVKDKNIQYVIHADVK